MENNETQTYGIGSSTENYTNIDVSGIISSIDNLNKTLAWSIPTKQQFIIDIASRIFSNNAVNSDFSAIADKSIKAAEELYIRLKRKKYFD